MARPKQDGGVWGSYVQYLEDLEAEVAILHAANEELARRLQEQTARRDGREGTHYYGDTCPGGHGELADIEVREAAQRDGQVEP